MRLKRAGGGGEGKARMGVGGRIGGDDVPNLDTSCSVSFDGGKLQPRFGRVLDLRSCKPVDPPQPQFPQHCNMLAFRLGSVGVSPCRVVSV